MRTNHEIDYRIYGEEMQYVEIELDPNETAIAESGAWMMAYKWLPFLEMAANSKTTACLVNY
jgi:hypothetical protein